MKKTKLKGEDKTESTAQSVRILVQCQLQGRGLRRKVRNRLRMKEEGKPGCLGGNSQRVPLLEHSTLFMYKPVTMPLVLPQQW